MTRIKNYLYKKWPVWKVTCMKNDRIKNDRIKSDRMKNDRIKSDRIKTDRIKSITDPLKLLFYKAPIATIPFLLTFW
jgi:hypothetical protein